VSSRTFSIFTAALAIATLQSSARPQGPGPWSDGFEAYAAGSLLHGQGGWYVFNTSSASVVNAPVPAHSGTNYVELTGGGSAVRPFTGYTTGEYVFKAYVYLPGPASANPLQVPRWFLVHNTYSLFGGYMISLQIKFDPATSPPSWTIDAGSPSTASGPYTPDKWSEIRCEIDLTLDQAEVFFDGALMAPPYVWSSGAFGQGTGAKAIAAVDLYSTGSVASGSTHWVDDLSLEPVGVPTTYCTAKTTSGGCVPAIGFSGSPSASAGSGFGIFASQVEPAKFGLFFYGKSGKQASPFQGGYLCAKAPLVRTPLQNSGGAAACSGTFAIDFNAFIASGKDPGLVAGATVDGQWWFRDPGFAPPNATGLTDAIDFTIQP
jgi:hypothetical protein